MSKPLGLEDDVAVSLIVCDLWHSDLYHDDLSDLNHASYSVMTWIDCDKNYTIIPNREFLSAVAPET